MITEIKTTKEVIVDTIKNTKDTVYIVVEDVIYQGDKYNAVVTYETREYEGGNLIGREVLHRIDSAFTVAEANALESALGVTGSTTTERLQDLVEKVTLYQAGALGLFGLTSGDFQAL